MTNYFQKSISSLLGLQMFSHKMYPHCLPHKSCQHGRADHWAPPVSEKTPPTYKKKLISQSRAHPRSPPALTLPHGSHTLFCAPTLES